MKKKLVLIGAGSVSFTKGLITDLLNRRPGGHDWTIALCDIDEKTLDGTTRLVKKMVEAKGLDIEVISCTDRRNLLPGADYVISTIGVGGRRSWEQDVFIPRKYGVYQPVGDTAMPGGISRAMRMVPAMLAIAKDIRELAPNARFLNYSNPMTVICRALDKAGIFPVTGLCHGSRGIERYIAEFMGYEKSRFTTLAAGINHCTFFYDFRYDGIDVKHEIRERIARDYKDVYDSTILDRFHGPKRSEKSFGEPFAWSFFLKYGAFLCPGDRHVTEFFTEYFPGGAYYGKKLGVDAYSFEGTIANGDKGHDLIMEQGFSPSPLPEDFFKHSGGEYEELTAIIDSIETDKRNIYYVNAPNRGAIPNLPSWAIIEMPAAATSAGLMPLYCDNFPDEYATMTNRFLAGIELTVDAALKGDRRLMEEAIMMGGYITDKNAVSKMTDELLAAQSEYLPQF